MSITTEHHNLRKAFMADRAERLTTPRTLTFSGDVTGSGSFDWTADLEIVVAVAKIPENISATEIGQLEGIQGNIQTQFDTLSTTLGDVEAALDVILGA